MRRRFPLAIAVWLGTCAVQPVSAADWTQFRGPAGNGLADDAAAPSQWSDDQQVAWKVEIPGVAWSQPVAWQDKVFVTTAVSDAQSKPDLKYRGPGVSGLALFTGGSPEPPKVDYRWKVLCLEAASGKLLWEKTAREGRPATHIHPTNTYASETPATDGQRLVAYFGMTGVYCYDLDGTLLWNVDLGAYPTQFGWGSGSSPVIHGDAVFIQCDNDQKSFLVALDKHTGQERWKVDREERSNWSTPYVWKNGQRTELVAAGGGKMRSYDPDTGTLLWEMAGSGRCSPTPVGDENLLFVDSTDRLMGRTGILAAVKAGASGDISLSGSETSNAFVAWSTKLAAFRVASPLLYQDCLYICEHGGGIVRCFDARTGQEHYRQRVPGAAGFTASPWASGGQVFCLDENGLTSVLAAGPKFQVAGSNKLDGVFWSSVARVGDRLLLRSVDHLYCVSR